MEQQKPSFEDPNGWQDDLTQKTRFLLTKLKWMKH